MKKRNRKVFSVLLACILAAHGGMTVAATSAKSKEEAQSKKAQLEQDLNEVNNAIGDLTAAKQELEETVAQLDGQLTDLSEQIHALDQQIAEKEKEIKRVKKQLKKAKEAEQTQYEDMKKRIQYLYENGDYASMEMLLSSQSIADLLNNAEYIAQIAEYDRMMLAKYQKTKDKVAKKEKKLQEDYRDSKQMKQEVEQQEAQVQSVMEGKQEEIQNYTARISDQEQKAWEYESEMEAQQAILDEIQAAEEAAAAKAAEEARQQEAAALEAQRKAEEAQALAEAAQAESDAQAQAQAQAEAERLRQEAEAARQEAEQQAQQETQQTEQETQQTESSSGGEATDTGASSQGGFVWPCPSSYTITSEFGGRESPTAGASSNHQGIDIGAPQGSAIVAAASGTVVTAAYSVSAGNYVIISHGNGISTVYMHASALYVSAGQTVSAGESIAAVGSTGYSTGAHLHFGVTVNGSYVNPHQYVG